MTHRPSNPNWARTSSSHSSSSANLSPEAQLAVHQAYHEAAWEDHRELKDTVVSGLAELHDILDGHDSRIATMETFWKVIGVVAHPAAWRIIGGMFVVAAALSATPLGKQILAVVPTP